MEKIEHKASSLNQYPERGRAVRELLNTGISIYRELIIRPWHLLYHIEGKNIYVMAVLDSRRNIQDFLLQRLIKPE